MDSRGPQSQQIMHHNHSKTYIGFEALHEVSIYNWFAVTPCVCIYLLGRVCAWGFGRLLSSEKNCVAFLTITRADGIKNRLGLLL